MLLSAFEPPPPACVCEMEGSATTNGGSHQAPPVQSDLSRRLHFAGGASTDATTATARSGPSYASVPPNPPAPSTAPALSRELPPRAHRDGALPRRRLNVHGAESSPYRVKDSRASPKPGGMGKVEAMRRLSELVSQQQARMRSASDNSDDMAPSPADGWSLEGGGGGGGDGANAGTTDNGTTEPAAAPASASGAAGSGGEGRGDNGDDGDNGDNAGSLRVRQLTHDIYQRMTMGGATTYVTQRRASPTGEDDDATSFNPSPSPSPGRSFLSVSSASMAETRVQVATTTTATTATTAAAVGGVASATVPSVANGHARKKQPRARSRLRVTGLGVLATVAGANNGAPKAQPYDRAGVGGMLSPPPRPSPRVSLAAKEGDSAEVQESLQLLKESRAGRQNVVSASMQGAWCRGVVRARGWWGTVRARLARSPP